MSAKRGEKSQTAARKAFSVLDGKPELAPVLMKEARRLIFLKGTNAHDYKFSSAVLEDFYHVSPRWQAHYLATSMGFLRGSGDPNNELIARTRDALAKS